VPWAICPQLTGSSVARHGSPYFRGTCISVWHIKYRYAVNCPRKFRDERTPSWQTIYNFVSKLRTTGLWIDTKPTPKRRLLSVETLEDIGARLEHTPRKSVKRLTEDTGVSKSSARMATWLLKLRPYKTTVIHTLQPCDSAGRVRFCSWFLQSIAKDQIYPQLTFFSHETWFPLWDT
jgi:hypothetical protein